MKDKCNSHLVCDENLKIKMRNNLIKTNKTMQSLKVARGFYFAICACCITLLLLIANILFNTGSESLERFTSTHLPTVVSMAVILVTIFVLFALTAVFIRKSRIDKTFFERSCETCDIGSSEIRISFISKDSGQYISRKIIGKQKVEIVIPFYEIVEMNTDLKTGLIVFIGEFKLAVIDRKTNTVKETCTINGFEIYDYFSPTIREEMKRRI